MATGAPLPFEFGNAEAVAVELLQMMPRDLRVSDGAATCVRRTRLKARAEVCWLSMVGLKSSCLTAKPSKHR